ncbi:hypothetical protein [Spongiimicrobium salis]|uniref:hypothetical protein n=1 Tax=Spongiimicrobium salis TaxID=1667022 RepID=UPI00374DEC34
MTKEENEILESLKMSFQLDIWEDFLLVLNEIRGRDKEIISMYRNSHIHLKRLKNACTNAINELNRLNGSIEIAKMELEKGLKPLDHIT